MSISISILIILKSLECCHWLMSATTFGDANNWTTRHFLCCLHNRTDTNEGRRNGLTPLEVYNKLEEGQALPGPEGVFKTWIITQLVIGCEWNGYIKPVNRPPWAWWWPVWFDRIKITPAGIDVCNRIESDGIRYCSKVPAYKD
jgi:hypothetical protein